MDSIELIAKADEIGMERDTDNYGQIVIYTGMKRNKDGEIVPMTEEDFNNEEAWYKA